MLTTAVTSEEPDPRNRPKPPARHGPDRTGGRSAKTPGRFVTVPEAARRSGLSERTIWARISAGKLSCHRFGARATRIREDDLEDFIRQHRSGKRGV